MKSVLGVVMLGCLSLYAGNALAADYVCAVTYDPPPNNLGSSGGIELTLNTAPKCAGSQTGIKRFCTPGGTNTGCASGVSLSLTALMQVYQNAMTAMASSLRVSGQVATCNGGGSGCWSNTSFFAN